MRSKMAISQAAGHVRGFAATDGGPALAGRRREDERKRYGPVTVADESEGFSAGVNPFPPLLDERSVASTCSGFKAKFLGAR